MDVYDTRKILVGAGCLAPYYLLGGLAADFQVVNISLRVASRSALRARPWIGDVASRSFVSSC